MAEPEPEPPEQGYRHLNITNRIGHSKVKVLRDGRITVFTSAKAERLTSHMQKKSRKQPEGGQTRTRAKKSDKNDYKAILGDFEGLPRINIAIHIVGSRGDVQPFIAIGHELSKPPYSHRVRICTHAVFKDFVEENGLEFFSIGGDPANLMAYMVKNPGLLPGMDSIKAGDVSKRRLEMAEIFEGAWRSCIEPGNGLPEDPNIVRTKAEESDRLFIADAIIANPPSYAHLHCAEKLSIPLHIIFTMPWSPTQMFPHPLANIAPSDVDSNIANYISYPMTELLAWQGLGDLINRFRVKTLNLDPISPLWGHVLLARLKVPFTYCWSQELIPKPKDWGPHINITGFSFLSLASSYKPPDDLAEFLAAGPPPVYIGFGSIVVQKPNELTTLIFNAVKRAGVRALVSKGWGGLGEDAAPEGVFMLGNCPHDWLFKHVSAVVHHGGAGTTAIGLALGKPTVIVPFFGDQPFWGAMVYKAGAGPEPVPFKKMTEESLAHSIQQALGPGIQIAAEKMGETIRNEKPGALEAARSFQTAINLDAMKCYLAPDKVAVWRIKKTNLQLSGLAVGLLIENKHVRVDEIKLMRHIDWYMDEGAEGPVVGAVAAVAETVTSLVNNIEDYFKALSKTFQKKPPEKEVSPQDSIELADTTKVETNGLQELPTNLDFQDVIDNDDNFERHLDSLAWHMAAKTTTKRKKKSRGCLPASMQRKKKKKSFHSATGPRRSTNGPRPSTIGPRPSHDHDHGPALEVAHDTTVFAQSMVEAWLKAPVALFYNIANGLHNFPSYVFHDDTVRRRENITGLGSGAKVAAQGWGFGMFDAITGLVTQPYLGAKKQGVAGFGKGIGKGVGGLVFKTVAAQFGLIGYTLKGVEKQILKRRSRDLKARIIAVRLRQGLIEYERSTPEERQAILERWDKIKGLVRAV